MIMTFMMMADASFENVRDEDVANRSKSQSSNSPSEPPTSTGKTKNVVSTKKWRLLCLYPVQKNHKQPYIYITAKLVFTKRYQLFA